jgi:DNA integrity scanning protein DisA with diadenylate cyclase activity
VPDERVPLEVDGRRGMRHIAGIRYSRDDPSATVVVISEDGPVTVLRDGVELGHSELGC